jgi:UDP-N-acetylmuramoyl-tripeptide--D-alanyl-D-alanine ligase
MATPIPRNEATFTARAIAGATNAIHATFRGPDHTVVGVTTDSRAVTIGCAFVALRGERHDAHAFLADAVRSGAQLVVVEEGRGGGVDADVVEVKDTLVAWGDLARAHLHSWRHASRGGRIVAITGSAGKTTTKELTSTLLATCGACHTTLGNLNNRIGLPAVALGITSHHQFGVFEVGMSVPGEIAAMASIVQPEVAVITNVGVAHAEGVGGSRQAVGFEKGALIEALAPDGVAVVNADDDVAMAQLPRTRASHVETFGRAASARYRLVDRTSHGAKGARVRIARPDGGEIELNFPLIGEAAAIDLVAALAATEAAAGVTLDAARANAALADLAARGAFVGRGAVSTLADGTIVIDDTYNANPQSMRAALASLREVAAPEGRRMVVVLGEMKELGPLAESEHASLGAALAETGVAVAISCGGLMDLTISKAAAAGIATHTARTTDEAAQLALREVRAGDVVLVKGSRSVGTEKVVLALAGRSA